jgi:GntR family transcriptional regulator
MTSPVTPIGSRIPLSDQLLRDLRTRLLGGEWDAGERLPSEAELAATYQVSRVTVRTALKGLESQGLVRTRHGAGTFAEDLSSGIRAGLQQLRSISDTIRELGHKPSMQWRHCEEREANDVERERLELPAGALVLDLERAFLADGEPVAFSYDAIPSRLLPQGVAAQLLGGSVFALFDELGIVPTRALAEVHAVQSEEIGWDGVRPAGTMFVELDQVHYDRRSVPLMHSRTFFVEGRFQFVILRTR